MKLNNKHPYSLFTMPTINYFESVYRNDKKSLFIENGQISFGKFLTLRKQMTHLKSKFNYFKLPGLQVYLHEKIGMIRVIDGKYYHTSTGDIVNEFSS